MSASKRVAFIIASTRAPRAGPSIAKVVTGIITPLLPSNITLTVVDLMDHPLPLYTAEPIIPAGLVRPVKDGSYTDAATNAWSALVRGFDAFIFLTPQHNWGYPASLKLALDALFHEWSGKAALIVSYGSRGGGKSAGQLRQVFAGLHMCVCERGVELPFEQGHDVCGGEIGQATNDRWRAENKKAEMVQAWDELVSLVNAI
ncbi:NADPH-dependent FMN reductase-domain-containing protein [Mycena belliarum]|uniref:NADPH-dependent FMN reductase-domain-containing protein n=1 Tax=Mycena belliarum TaxID=1033014 RepID=A0AAD6XFV3_9AGAR|nr:NADPH-dependent FMN reductase-domain-containing protein [Mycena belliae]